MKKGTRSANAKLTNAFHDRIVRGSAQLDPRIILKRLLSCRPMDAQNAYAFKWDYLKDECLSKYCGPATTSSDVRRDRAIDKLLRADATCAETNDRLRCSDLPGWFGRAQQLVGLIIGDPADALDAEFAEQAIFTSGAAVGFTRRTADPYFKYEKAEGTVTHQALPYAEYLIQLTPLWDQSLKIVDGNVVFTVPKKEDIDRAAAKEPSLNQALQKALGNYIRKRLRRFGINLNDQSINRRLARKGSLDGSLATIDLSAASDSISTRLVYELLGPRWYKLLSDLRSPCGILPDGSTHKWNLFSTMGNGYTFELESLLFFVIAKSVSESVVHSHSSPIVSVYGDDIIVESRCAPSVIAALEFSGFRTNANKTFVEGPFRESCGGHYYNGINVKPFYIRRPIDSPQRVIWLLNAIRQWASDDDGWCDPSVYNFWLSLRREFVPPEFLGGRNLASISEVVSPEEPRFSFIRLLKNKRIDGSSALLRYFQYNSEERSLYDAVYSTSALQYYANAIQPERERVTDWKAISCIGSREFSRVVRYSPSIIRFSVFPQEADIDAVNLSLLHSSGS